MYEIKTKFSATDLVKISQALWALPEYRTEPDDPFVGNVEISHRVCGDFQYVEMGIKCLAITFDYYRSLLAFGISINNLYPELSSAFAEAPMLSHEWDRVTWSGILAIFPTIQMNREYGE